MVRRSSTLNLTHQVAQTLGTAIVAGNYSAGFPKMADLRKQLGVSRCVLREAVKMLAAKGLLAASPRLGTWVQKEENWNLLDPDVLLWLPENNCSLTLFKELAQVRLAIEPKAAALAAVMATPEQRDAIKSAVAGAAAADIVRDNPLPFDVAFHIAVLCASGNRFYAQLSRLIETTLRFDVLMRGAPANEHCVRRFKRMRAANAILMGDAEEAEASMHDLIEQYLLSATAESAHSPRAMH